MSSTDSQRAGLDVIQEAVVPTCHGNTRATAEAVLDALLALPVEQRMEAMGMERTPDNVAFQCWREAQ